MRSGPLRHTRKVDRPYVLVSMAFGPRHGDNPEGTGSSSAVAQMKHDE